MPAKRVVITTGDPAGCGPYITLKAMYDLRRERADFFVAADKTILQKIPFYKTLASRITLLDVCTPGIEKLKMGCMSRLAGQASARYLDCALGAMRRFRISRLVTAPVSKEAVKLVLPDFCGHTEYLAHHFGVKNFAMMMTSRKLKVVLFSRHVPLHNVSGQIQKKALLDTFSLVHTALKRCAKEHDG